MKERPPNLALVTGGAKRIGRAIAAALSERGWAVALHYGRSRDEAELLAADMRARGGRVQAFGADLADARAVADLLPQVNAAMGPVTLLVNNASLFERDELNDATLESWNSHLDINLRAPFFLSQAFARQLPETTTGNIINLLDMRVWRLTPHFMSYTVSKAGLWTLTQTLAMALAPRVRVNGVGPGPVLQSIHQTPEQFARQWASTPLGRGASPEEIAQACLFILSAPAMTGQMIALDGGQHLPWPPPSRDDE